MQLTFLHPWVLIALPLALLLLRPPTPIRVLQAPWSWGEGWAGPGARLAWHLPRGCAALATVALLVAAAGPVTRRPAPLPPEAAVAVMVALDVSPSMTGGSAPPLALATRALEAFLEREPGFRIGLVTFSGAALTRLPPTSDPALLRAALETATAGVGPEGTALGEAVGLAAARLRATQAHGRAVVLLTDGLHNAGALDPVSAAALARRDGMAVHAILLGGVPPEGDALLRAVVRAGGGRVVAAGEGVDGLVGTLTELAPPRGPQGEPVLVAAWPALLLAAVILLLAGEGVRALRPRGTG